MTIKKRTIVFLMTAASFFGFIFLFALDLGAVDSAQVELQWKKWYNKIARHSRAQGATHFTAVLFDQNLEPIRANRYRGSMGDFIYVGVLTDKTGKNNDTGHYYTATFSPCSLEPSVPGIFSQNSSASLSNSNKDSIKEVIDEEDGVTILEFPPGSCFNNRVTVTLNKISATGANQVNKATGTFAITQYNRYRATFQAGILFSNLHDNNFELKSVDSRQIIYNNVPEGTEPQYCMSLIIYSIPRYIQSLFSPKYNFEGRDIINDRSFVDRIGFVIGTSAGSSTKLLDRFHMGLSFELFFGVNVIGVYEFARFDVLAEELKVGSEFSGSIPIPTRSSWKSKLIFGLSFDFRYTKQMFKSVFNN